MLKMAWLSGWDYRKSHTINSATGAGTNYQVRIIVHYGSGSDSGKDVYLDSKCKTDFGDIRFTDDDGSTELDYWIEEKTDSDNAVFWVEVADDLSSSDATIYIYYGNDAVSTTSSVGDTFIFGDDFDNDLSSWSLCTGSSGDISESVSNGVLEYDVAGASNVHRGHYRQLSGGLDNYMVESKVRRDSDDPSHKFGIWVADYEGTFYSVDNGWVYYLSDWQTEGERERAERRGNGTGGAYAGYSIGTDYHRLGIHRDGNDFAFFLNGEQQSTGTLSTINNNYIQLWVYAYQSNCKLIFDWLIVRKYVDSEPSHGSWGNEEESTTIVVGMDECYSGVESKQTVIQGDGTNTVITVTENVPSEQWDKTAIIENLVIDGNGSPVGILLKNVYNCIIRNVTIKNCTVGIQVEVDDGYWSHANRFEHIRIKDVTTGISFKGDSDSKDFSFTTIDDVGISLNGQSSAVGIKIGYGNQYASLYNAFIKATVWLGDSGGKGMEVNGELKLSLVNLEVEQDDPEDHEDDPYDGKGLVVNSGAVVYDNQSFLLTTGGITSDNRKIIYGTFQDVEPYFMLRGWLPE